MWLSVPKRHERGIKMQKTINYTLKDTKSLKPYERNPRDNEKAVDAVAESIKEFGFNVPILIDKDNVIVAGHTRLKAAEKLGLEQVPCITLDMSEEDLREYRIIDNKTGELANWDYEKLVMELASIPEIDMEAFELNYPHLGTGEGGKLIDTNLDEGFEIELEEFDDEVFENECPYCGFRWS